MKITSTKNLEQKGISILVYSQPGVGKTTLARTLPGKTLIISAEAGLLPLAGLDINVIDITLDENGNPADPKKKMLILKEALEYVSTKKDFDNLFIDSLSEISQIFIEYLSTVYTERKDSLVLFGENAKLMRKFIKTCRDIPHYNVIITALEKDDFDDMKRKTYRPEIVGKAGVDQFFDEVFNYRIILDGEAPKRLLMTNPHDGRVAKDRSGKLNFLEEPNLDNIINKIRS